MSIGKLVDMIKDVKIAMFTTVDRDGMLRSRPLATLDPDTVDAEQSTLWFFTTRDSGKVDEIGHAREVNLAYADTTHQRYISVSGAASMSDDRARIQRFWKPVHRAWFPGGPEDPQLTLIRVRVRQAEYWDAPANAVVNAIGMAKAIMIGERYDPGEHDRLQLGSAPAKGEGVKAGQQRAANR